MKISNTKITTIFDPEYPPILRETYKPPLVLYSQGDLRLLTMERLLSGCRFKNSNILW